MLRGKGAPKRFQFWPAFLDAAFGVVGLDQHQEWLPDQQHQQLSQEFLLLGTLASHGEHVSKKESHVPPSTRALTAIRERVSSGVPGFQENP
jgi:hypothetical protein